MPLPLAAAEPDSGDTLAVELKAVVRSGRQEPSRVGLHRGRVFRQRSVRSATPDVVLVMGGGAPSCSFPRLGAQAAFGVGADGVVVSVVAIETRPSARAVPPSHLCVRTGTTQSTAAGALESARLTVDAHRPPIAEIRACERP